MFLKTSISLTALLCCSLSIFSCRGGDPEEKYELKSPCVANESVDGPTATPCIRRPANKPNVG